MQKLNGGYVMIDLNDTNNIYARAKAAIGCGKPIMIFDGPECYYADSISLDGDDNVIIVKGGKTITINDANAVSSEGDVSNPTMEKIKDLNGNLRFIEGDIEIKDSITAITQSYGKWSLSGSHLMLVIAGSVEPGANVSAGYLANSIDIPEWIQNKIYNIYTNVVNVKTYSLYTSGGVVVNSPKIELTKTTYGIGLYSGAINNTDSNAAYFRIQFDLVIDAE